MSTRSSPSTRHRRHSPISRHARRWARSWSRPERAGCRSMQLQHPVDGLEFRRLDQPAMGDRDAVEQAVDLARPEIEEALEHRELRSGIVFLPDEILQQAGMVGQTVEYIGGDQAIALHLLDESGADGPRGTQRIFRHETSFLRRGAKQAGEKTYRRMFHPLSQDAGYVSRVQEKNH